MTEMNNMSYTISKKPFLQWDFLRVLINLVSMTETNIMKIITCQHQIFQ